MARESTFRDSVLQCRRQLPGALIRLLCLPYAGGGASIYRHWPENLAPDIEVLAAQLPGRENRLRSPAHRGMGALIDELLEALEELDPRPLAIFGHSFGATVAYELAYSLHKLGHTPAALIVSGRRPPHRTEDRELSKLDDEGLLARLRGLDGTPQVLLEHEELMQLLLPVLRADFSVLEGYRPGERATLPCSLLVCGGKEDPGVPREVLEDWRRHAGGPFRVEIFPGGHFYLAAEGAALLRQAIKDELLSRG